MPPDLHRISRLADHKSLPENYRCFDQQTWLEVSSDECQADIFADGANVARRTCLFSTDGLPALT
jgi:hypothetical protein